MAMSRKHYRALAEILRHAHECYPEAKDAIDHITRSIASICAEDNRAFRRQRFYDAAEPETAA